MSENRYEAACFHGEWFVLDLWDWPGNYIAGFKNQQEAEAEARRRNGPHLTIVGNDYVADDADDEKCPF